MNTPKFIAQLFHILGSRQMKKKKKTMFYKYNDLWGSFDIWKKKTHLLLYIQLFSFDKCPLRPSYGERGFTYIYSYLVLFWYSTDRVLILYRNRMYTSTAFRYRIEMHCKRRVDNPFPCGLYLENCFPLRTVPPSMSIQATSPGDRPISGPAARPISSSG